MRQRVFGFGLVLVIMAAAILLGVKAGSRPTARTEMCGLTAVTLTQWQACLVGR